MSITAVVIVIFALAVGLAIGWWLGNRAVAGMRAERDARTEDFRKAITDLAGAEERARAADQLRTELGAIRDDRDAARTEIATLRADARAFEARLAEMKAVREAMTAAVFNDVASKLLTRGAEPVPRSRRSAVQAIRRDGGAGAQGAAPAGQRASATL